MHSNRHVQEPQWEVATEKPTTSSADRRCSYPHCDKKVRSKGLCKAHGGGLRCLVQGCDRSSQGKGYCIRHGGGKRCTVTGCNRSSQSHGLCKSHGGGLRCQVDNCNKSSQGGGLCRLHGGGHRCQYAGCEKGAQRGGYCASHGGVRPCRFPNCKKNDRGGGFCAEHGGGRRCGYVGCDRPARKQGLCTVHGTSSSSKLLLGDSSDKIVPSNQDMLWSSPYNRHLQPRESLPAHHNNTESYGEGVPRESQEMALQLPNDHQYQRARYEMLSSDSFPVSSTMSMQEDMTALLDPLPYPYRELSEREMLLHHHHNHLQHQPQLHDSRMLADPASTMQESYDPASSRSYVLPPPAMYHHAS
ncbi:hypothetical protein LEN26_021319 [Aphanomyces euteiches]|nr:hypothetical protein LEN26_021319 [Aphanomyces euteiches]KAH9104350.1 hypothetical protein AeMF1_019549 [Aphanomyces euteiches]KAH9189713.1 hypothetical protein AeNC1_008317 [Aphanomyces euteiches]